MNRIINYLIKLSIYCVLFISCGDNGSNPNNSVDVQPVDLSIELTDFLPHIGQYSEIRVISSTDSLSSLIIIDPIDATLVEFLLLKGLPSNNYHMDLFADVNHNRKYDSIPFDHSWRTMLPESGQIAFSHNTSFTDLRTPILNYPGEEFSLSGDGFHDQRGLLFEMKINLLPENKTVGLYRRPLLPDSTFSFQIPGIIIKDKEYRCDFYIDMNLNHTYNSPPIDFAWSLTGIGTDSGLYLNYSFDSNFIDVNF